MNGGLSHRDLELVRKQRALEKLKLDLKKEELQLRRRWLGEEIAVKKADGSSCPIEIQERMTPASRLPVSVTTKDHVAKDKAKEALVAQTTGEVIATHPSISSATGHDNRVLSLPIRKRPCVVENELSPISRPSKRMSGNTPSNLLARTRLIQDSWQRGFGESSTARISWLGCSMRLWPRARMNDRTQALRGFSKPVFYHTRCWTETSTRTVASRDGRRNGEGSAGYARHGEAWDRPRRRTGIVNVVRLEQSSRRRICAR
jgi:hypothetical protein